MSIWRNIRDLVRKPIEFGGHLDPHPGHKDRYQGVLEVTVDSDHDLRGRVERAVTFAVWETQGKHGIDAAGRKRSPAAEPC